MERHVAIDAFVELLALSTMTLATCNAEGAPHAAPVYFAAAIDQPGSFPAQDEMAAWQAPCFYFFSDPKSQHAQDLAAIPQAGAAIYPPCFDWQDIRGLQVRGVVRIVEKGVEWDLGWSFYQAKFPFTAGLMDIIATNSLHILIPDWIRLVDNRRGFGFKQEWQRP